MEKVPGINENFEVFGYSTKSSFLNYGSSSFLFLVVPVAALAAKVVSKMGISGVSQRAETFYKGMFWNNIIGYCYEMYTVIAICSLMNIYYFRFDNLGNIINSAFCIIFGLITLVLPVFYSIFYLRNFKRFLAREANIISRFGTLV